MPKKATREEFIMMAMSIHGSKYDYSKVEYKGNKINVEIVCPLHGPFLIRPNDHTSFHKSGCPHCGLAQRVKTQRKSQEKFINEVKARHKNKYDYSKVNYVTAHSIIEIICPKHGSFFQTANEHRKGYGCANCFESKGEASIASWLIFHSIPFVRQKTFPSCKGRNNKCLRFDFYLPEHNICIEYDGQQHFHITHWHKKTAKLKGTAPEDELATQQLNDLVKELFCKEHNIKLVRIKFDETDITNRLSNLLL